MNVFLTIVIVLVSLIIIMKVSSYLFSNKSMLLDNIVDAKTLTIISASSLEKSPVGNNNFAYSTWFYVSDWQDRYNEYKVILGRMSAPTAPSATSNLIPGINGTGPCPLICLGKTQNDILIMQNCYNGISTLNDVPSGTGEVMHTCTVPNIPIQKWVNLIVSVYGRTLDVYIDGKLVKTCLMPGIAKVNVNADLLITPQGGFSGWTARTQYFASPMNPDQAWSIYSKNFKHSNILSMFLPDYSVKVSVINNSNNSENNYTL